MTTVAYGEEMWKTTGEDLNAWNVETMHYINEAFFNFWPVDVFNFCTYFWCFTDMRVSYRSQCDLSLLGLLGLTSSEDVSSGF